MKPLRPYAAVVLMMLLSASPARAAVAPAERPDDLIARVDVVQKLGTELPLDTRLRDEQGNEVTLGSFFGTRPVVLALVYYECPMLCTQVLNGLVSALGVINFDVGRELDVVAVSFNPKEGPGLAAQKKAAYVERYARPHTAPGWHFLTGTQDSIDRLAKAVGFRYEYDAKIEQYAHGAGIELVTPRGTISKYFYGIEFSARDIRFGVIEASEERIGTPIDDVLLLCYHYDPATGTYGAAVLRLVRLGGIATMLAIAGFLFVSLRHERASARPSAQGHRS